MIFPFFTIGIGAAFGAYCRYLIGLFFNPILFTLPLGTLIVNLFGSFAIGCFLPFSTYISTSYRLFFITGFLGSFTTYSTFSAEVINFFLHKQFFSGSLTILSHLFGSLLMTAFGYIFIKTLMRL